MSYGLPWAQVSNSPFRRYKSWAHEGGVSTPFIAHLPGVVPAGVVEHGVGHVVDVLPTLLEVTGASYPTRRGNRSIHPLEGQSLLPLLAGEGEWRRGPLCWEHEGKRAVRTATWKLVAMHNGPWELYDMTADRTECHDLSADRPDVVAELSAVYDEWADRLAVAEWDAIGEQQREADERDRRERAIRTPG
jgi:arylsulfatase